MRYFLGYDILLVGIYFGLGYILGQGTHFYHRNMIHYCILQCYKAPVVSCRDTLMNEVLDSVLALMHSLEQNKLPLSQAFFILWSVFCFALISFFMILMKLKVFILKIMFAFNTLRN